MYVTFITTHRWPSGFCPHGYRGNARATPPSPSLAQLGTWGYGVPTQACVPVTSFVRILHRGYQFTTYRVIQVIRSYRLFVAPQSRLLPRHAAPHIHTYMVPTATAPNAVPALPGVIYASHANVRRKKTHFTPTYVSAASHHLVVPTQQYVVWRRLYVHTTTGSTTCTSSGLSPCGFYAVVRLTGYSTRP